MNKEWNELKAWLSIKLKQANREPPDWMMHAAFKQTAVKMRELETAVYNQSLADAGYS